MRGILNVVRGLSVASQWLLSGYSQVASKETRHFFSGVCVSLPFYSFFLTAYIVFVHGFSESALLRWDSFHTVLTQGGLFRHETAVPYS